MSTLNPLPKGLKTNNIAGVICITRRWYSANTWLYLIFTLVWNGFVFQWYDSVLNSDSQDITVLLFPVIHVGLGLWLIYKTLTGFFNSTEIQIGSGKFVVSHGPFPWIGNKQVESRMIKQIFCDEKTTRNRNSSRVSYRVNAVMKDDSKETLVAAGVERDQALYIEQIAEKHFGIEPAPVVGEL